MANNRLKHDWLLPAASRPATTSGLAAAFCRSRVLPDWCPDLSLLCEGWFGEDLGKAAQGDGVFALRGGRKEEDVFLNVGGEEQQVAACLRQCRPSDSPYGLTPRLFASLTSRGHDLRQAGAGDVAPAGDFGKVFGQQTRRSIPRYFLR